MPKALVVVDVQRDFCEGGSLAVAGGLEVARRIHEVIRDGNNGYKKIVATKDWHNPHTDNGGHFHDTPDFSDTWPGHCLAHSDGAMFAGTLDALDFDDIFHKGWNKPAYSGFEGVSAYNTVSTLSGYLGIYGIEEVDIVGIASTHCVKATVMDALKLQFDVVRVIEELTAGVDVDGTGKMHREAIDDMRRAGAVIL